MSEESMHWADQTARKIIKVKKDQYVCASGITPSGIVHIGNFREIITVELVVRALKDLGKKTRFIYSWDDYDVFRKVPKGWPKQDELKKELRKPIVDVPDPYDKEESFARHNEVAVEKELSKLGINPEFIYQSKQYRKCAYKEGMRKALEHSKEIKSILDNYRKEPLSDSWLPISIFDP
ncbi:MAG: lysine--tRNA ligase, partial [Thermodesulfovibrionia bacterium]|nr:lysine--tRNA ligase [Thermodesulfovibrionia bacterium]